MTRAAAPWLLLLALVSCDDGTPVPPCEPHPGAKCSILVGNRGVFIYVPPSYVPGASALVIALHPLNRDGSFMELLTDLDAKADQAGFAIAYPTANITFNSRRSWTWFFKEHYGGPYESDIEHIRQIIQVMQTSIQPDPRRIYVTGYSDGADMTHRAAVQLGDLVAAVAVVEGTLYYTPAAGPQNPAVPAAAAPVSVLIFHGDLEDSAHIPYCGGTDTVGYTLFASQDQTVDYWLGAAGDNCATIEPPARLCNPDGTVSDVIAKHGTDCAGGVEVRFYRLLGTRHEFFNTPGHWSLPLNSPLLDATTGTTAVDVLWRFFEEHPKP